MPIHPLFFNIFDIKLLSLWRDFLIILLLIMSFSNSLFRYDFLSKITFYRCALCILFALFSHDSSMDLGIWINVLRIYLISSMLIFIIHNMNISFSRVLNICKIYVITAVVESLFGIFQMYVIGPIYLHIIGVGQSSVLLADGTQRNIGTFESANVLAVYLFVALILLIELKLWENHVIVKNLILAILAVGLLLTYSMSVFLAVFAYLIDRYLLINVFELSINSILRYIKILFLALFASLSAYIYDESKFIDTIYQINEKIQDIISTLSGTNYISTSSASVHFYGLIEGISLLINNINGLGFAKDSFMVADKVASRYLIGIYESSYLTIFFDFGVFVGILYLMPLFYMFYKFSYTSSNKIKNIMFYKSGKYIILGLLVPYVFLPLIQSYELSFFVFLFGCLFLYKSQTEYKYK